MDTFEFNKIAGSILAALLVIFGSKTLSEIIFSQPPPVKPGYEIKVAAANTTGADSKPSAVAQEEPIGARLAGADIGRGQSVAKKCKACHSFNKAGKNGVGPNLWSIVQRDIGKAAGYSYSPALLARGGKWDFTILDAFITNPKKAVPNTKMGYKGISKPGQRADLILYLRSLSDSPVPLPAEKASKSQIDTKPKTQDTAQAN